jgi:hypothetical protein
VVGLQSLTGDYSIDCHSADAYSGLDLFKEWFNLSTDGDTDHFFCSGTIYESSGDRQKIVTVANLVKKCADTDELAEGLTVGPSLYYNRLLL